jgi:hypothetical protein
MPQTEPSLEGVRELIERCKSFSSERARESEERAAALKVALKAFWPQFLKARKAWKRREEAEAPRFNVIRLLKLHRLEMNHSKILGDLLDPKGTHGQGSRFLKGFLRRIGSEHLGKNLDANDVHVDVGTERWISTESRVDIIVQCAPWFVLIIENKIRGDEGIDSQGKWQLRKYRKWLDSRAEPAKILVFLTTRGGPSKSGAEDCAISYLHDIRPWLQELLEQAAPRVRETLVQYLDTIEDLPGPGEDTTDGDEFDE